MLRNVEVKVRLPAGALDRLRLHLEEIGAEDHGLLRQEDTFFRCSGGRLKIRREDGPGGRRAELIFYRRPDASGPKLSEYLIARVDDPPALERILASVLGLAGSVVKERRLFIEGRTRVHLDRVENRGEFLELEVVLAEGEDPRSGRVEAEALLGALGLADAPRLHGAYLDLSPGG